MASIQGDCEMGVGGEFVRVKELGNQNHSMSSSVGQDEFEFVSQPAHCRFQNYQTFWKHLFDGGRLLGE